MHTTLFILINGQTNQTLFHLAGRKQKWQQIQGEVAQEYDVVKNIMQTLALFKAGETHDSRQVGPGLRSMFEEPTRDPDVWPAPPPRDNMWSGGASGGGGGGSGSSGAMVKPVRGPPRKDSKTSKATAGGKGGGDFRKGSKAGGPNPTTKGGKVQFKILCDFTNFLLFFSIKIYRWR